MSTINGIKFRDCESRRGTIRNALDEQTDYEQVRFRWLFGFIHVRHFFALIQVCALYVFTPFLLLCGSVSKSCPSTLMGEHMNGAVQAMFVTLAVFVILCVIISSVAFHWTEKLRYMSSPYVNSRFCQLSPMPFVMLFFVHQLFIFALLIFFLYAVFISSRFNAFVARSTAANTMSLVGGGVLPFVLFMALMVYVIYGDFRFWNYACFVREHTKLKRRLAKIDADRGYKSGFSMANMSRHSARSLSDVIGSNSIREKIQRYRQSLSRNSITTETNNSFNQTQKMAAAPLLDRIDDAGDNGALPQINSYASSADLSLNESRDSRGRRIIRPVQGNAAPVRPAAAYASQSPPASVRLQRNPIYTDNSDVELMHVLDTIGEVPEDHSG